MGIKVTKPGLLTTLQDLGRTGYRKDGIIVSGAMDALALQVGNLLLGNKEGEAGLECTLMGPSLLFEQDQLIALTGGNLNPAIDGQPVKMWRPLFITKGSTLSFGAPDSGCRTYITVYGGFNVPEVLGSKSTYLKAGFGGLDGRMLKKEDVLLFRESYKGSGKLFNWSLDLTCYPDLQDDVVRVVKGPEYDWFDNGDILFREPYLITKEADRMGYRLQGSQLPWKTSREMLSSAVAFGTIQVTSAGAAILLMADHQTTGGYPRIAQVVSADLVKLAQMRGGQQIHFEMVSLDCARELLLIRQKQLRQLKQTITFKYL